MIDSQMDDMIREKLALKEQVDSLEQNLSKQIKEKECLLQTFTVFKSESKEKEDKYMENEIDLEKKIKELDTILFKVGQSAQTVHMLTKPHAFYDNIHKQALGYQNPFYLRKAQRIKPTLYDGIVMSDKHSTVDKQCLEIAKKEVLLENDRLLQQIMSQEVLLTVMNSMSLIGESVNMDGKRKETCNLEAELFKSQNAFNDLLKRHSQLEKHSQLQDKDNTIYKLKDMIKSMREKSKDENVKYDYCEIENKNVKLENKNEDLKAQIQDKVFVITSLKNDLQKITGKDIIDIASQIPSTNTIVLGMFKLDLEPLAPSAKKVAVTPKNKVKKFRFAEPLTSSSNSKQVESSKILDSNTHVLSSIGLQCSTSKSRSKPTGNKRNDRISQTPSKNMKNKVESQPRKVNKKNRVVKPICDDNVNSGLNCATCKKYLLDDVHDKCLLDFVKNVTSHAKSAK
ncbi:hypothetical protein Tco_0383500 [Tanacetum coccineum]